MEERRANLTKRTLDAVKPAAKDYQIFLRYRSGTRTSEGWASVSIRPAPGVSFFNTEMPQGGRARSRLVGTEY